MSVFADSKIDHVVHSGIDWPGGKTGDVLFIEFTLDGISHQAMNGGPDHPFTDAISLSNSCDDQAEIDRLWDALTADGGKPIMCGWLKDKFGLHWQIVPVAHQRMMREADADQMTRLLNAMGDMVKFDIAQLEAAYAHG